MQTATSETEIKFRYLSICVHHYTLRAPCPKGQGTCAHTAWKPTSAPLFFCTSGKETVKNLQISRGQLAPYQENRIKRQQTVSSAGCKVLVPNVGFLLASMLSYCRFKPVECSY